MDPGKAIFATLSVSLAAICVWLVVRIVNRGERWAKWTLVWLVVLVIYPLSYTPAGWFIEATGADWARPAVKLFYWPVLAAVEKLLSLLWVHHTS